MIPLVCNIGKVYCKTAEDKNKEEFHSDVESKFIEINSDFYISMDVQAYTCLPTIS
jgi:hypothetical protein